MHQEKNNLLSGILIGFGGIILSFMGSEELLIGTFVLMPIITLIHELGHVFFAKLFGAKIKSIVIGSGRTSLAFGKLEIKAIYFWCGYFTADKIGNSKLTKIITLLGGILFNIASCSIIILLFNLNVIGYNDLYNVFIYFSLFSIVANILPINFFNNMNTDGLQICQIIKSGTSTLYNNKRI